MRELAGKTAFVTGGASGIGFALGRAFAEEGMKVMLADIETDALAAAVKALRDSGPDVRGTTCDVADPLSVERAAKASYEAFGNVHVVCNNAGAAGGSGIDDIWLDTWRWVARRQPHGGPSRNPYRGGRLRLDRFRLGISGASAGCRSEIHAAATCGGWLK
jgi:NAD(P)-dependent dehydrogenase (short-subunit alcohol dehydrogenase family)